MPLGSSLRISSSVVVHGRTEEKTCCSRMRRAMSWVYSPPKSRTTTPPRSELGFSRCSCMVAPVAIVLLSYKNGANDREERSQEWLCHRPSFHHQVQQFVRHEHAFYYALSIDMLRHKPLGHGPGDKLAFREARGHLQPSADPPVHLHYHFDLFFARQVRIDGRPTPFPESIAIPNPFPYSFPPIPLH